MTGSGCNAILVGVRCWVAAKESCLSLLILKIGQIVAMVSNLQTVSILRFLTRWNLSREEFVVGRCSETCGFGDRAK
eukprot:5534355-Amphidinium_carterae.1